MPTHDSVLIRHALAVLEQYAEDARSEPSPSLQLALRALAGYVHDRYYLDVFWRIANGPGGLPRRGNLLKTLAVIRASVQTPHTAVP